MVSQFQVYLLIIIASEMHSREVVFEPLDAQVQRSQGIEPIFLRCRKELLEPESAWYVNYVVVSSISESDQNGCTSGLCTVT